MNTSYTGFYRGTVVQQLTHGFCKIAIPGILYFTDDSGNIDIDKLPPAECAGETFGGINGAGVFNYPDLQSTVWCFFEDGNTNKPVYFALANSNSPNWNSASVAVQKQTDIPGYALSPVTASGKVINFGDSQITQSVVLNPDTGTPVSTAIELTINHTLDNARALGDATTENTDTSLGKPRAASTTIRLDNANSKISIFAADTIEISAPTIILNGTKLGSLSNVTINSHKININSDDTTTLTNTGLFNISDEVIDLTSGTERHIFS